VKASKLAEDACLVYEIMKNSKEGNTDKKFIQETKLASFEKNAKEIEQIYKSTINEYNEFLDYYNNQTVCYVLAYNSYLRFCLKISLMDSFQKQEEQRINIVKESVMKILISEISCIRNLQYDVDKISKVEKRFLEKKCFFFFKEN